MRNAEYYRAYYAKTRERRRELRAARRDQISEKSRARYAENREPHLERGRIYREKNREEIREKNRRRYVEDKDRLRLISREAQREARRRDPDGVREVVRAWRTKNRDKVLERQRQYLQTPKGQQVRIYNQARALIAGSAGIRYSEVPDELAELKVIYLLIIREIRAQRKAA